MNTHPPYNDLTEELFQIGVQVKLAGSLAVPLAGAAALGLPLAGYLGMQYGRSEAEQAAKSKALAGFGAGLATGVAAPRLVGKLQNVLGKLQGGAPGAAPPGAVPRYPKMGSADEYAHLQLLLEKDAGVADVIGKGIGLGVRAGKAVASVPGKAVRGVRRAGQRVADVAAETAAPKGQREAVRTQRAMRRSPGEMVAMGDEPAKQLRLAEPEKMIGPAPAPKPTMPQVAPTTRITPPSEAELAREFRGTAPPPQPKMVTYGGTKGKGGGKATADAADAAKGPDVAEAAEAAEEAGTPLWHYGAMAGLPMAGLGAGYLMGQQRAEQRPFLQRMFP